jgi:hypothetical protein
MSAARWCSLGLLALISLGAPLHVAHAQQGTCAPATWCCTTGRAGRTARRVAAARDGMLRFPGLPDDILRRGVDVTRVPRAGRGALRLADRRPRAGMGRRRRDTRSAASSSCRATSPTANRHAHAARDPAPRARARRIAAATRRCGHPALVQRGLCDLDGRPVRCRQGWMLRLAFADRPRAAARFAHARLAAHAGGRAAGVPALRQRVRYLHSLGTAERSSGSSPCGRSPADFEQALREVYVLHRRSSSGSGAQHVRRRYGWLQIIAQTHVHLDGPHAPRARAVRHPPPPRPCAGCRQLR